MGVAFYPNQKVIYNEEELGLVQSLSIDFNQKETEIFSFKRSWLGNNSTTRLKNAPIGNLKLESPTINTTIEYIAGLEQNENVRNNALILGLWDGFPPQRGSTPRGTALKDTVYDTQGKTYSFYADKGKMEVTNNFITEYSIQGGVGELTKASVSMLGLNAEYTSNNIPQTPHAPSIPTGRIVSPQNIHILNRNIIPASSQPLPENDTFLVFPPPGYIYTPPTEIGQVLNFRCNLSIPRDITYKLGNWNGVTNVPFAVNSIGPVRLTIEADIILGEDDFDNFDNIIISGTHQFAPNGVLFFAAGGTDIELLSHSTRATTNGVAITSVTCGGVITDTSSVGIYW